MTKINNTLSIFFNIIFVIIEKNIIFVYGKNNNKTNKKWFKL
jgi:hypothetical protein